MSSDQTPDPLTGYAPSPDDVAARLEEERKAEEAADMARAETAVTTLDGPLEQMLLKERDAMQRLDVATRLLVAWTVGKPEAADEVAIWLAADTAAKLVRAIKTQETQETTQ